MIPHMNSSSFTSDFRIYKTARTKRKRYGLCGSCRLQGVLRGPAGAGSCRLLQLPEPAGWSLLRPGLLATRTARAVARRFCSSLLPWSAAGPPSCFHRHLFCVHIRPLYKLVLHRNHVGRLSDGLKGVI